MGSLIPSFAVPLHWHGTLVRTWNHKRPNKLMNRIELPGTARADELQAQTFPALMLGLFVSIVQLTALGAAIGGAVRKCAGTLPS